MKKTLLFSGIALLALTSCQNDEDLMTLDLDNEDGNAQIAFRPAMGTRATEITNANLGDIYVTALQDSATYFKDVQYTKDSLDFYTHTPAYYWPGDPGKDYQHDVVLNFHAYAPSLDEIGADIELTNATSTKPASMVLTSYSPAENIADQVDFISANASGSRRANRDTGVALTFEHRLSQIELRAKNDNSNYIMEVAGMRIGRVETTGSFDFITNEWTLDDWHDTAIYDSSITPVALTSEPVSLMGEGGNAMLIPQTLTAWDVDGDPDNVARGAYLSVKIRITTKDGALVFPFQSLYPANQEYGWAAIPLSTTWEQGKKYVYTLDFSEGAGNTDPDDPIPGKKILDQPIKFTVNVSDWTDASTNMPMTPQPAAHDD